MAAMFLVTLAASLLVGGAVGVTKVHRVYWNTTNPIFRIDNTDHIVDVNDGNLPWEYDQLNLICPHNSLEQHVIYSVDRHEFDSCTISNPRPKIVAICNKPQEFMYFTITFRSFSPTPGGLEFKPGQNYYFISTSTQRNIHRRAGGFCSSHNMKMIFKVADNAVQEAENSVEGDSLVQLSLQEPRQYPGSNPRQYPRVWSARVPQHRNDYIYYYKPWARASTSSSSRSVSAPAASDSRLMTRALPLTSSSGSSCAAPLLTAVIIALFAAPLISSS